MFKGITEADAYECRLSDELKCLAEKELRETSATRDFALKALREWIEANPRIASARLGEKYPFSFISFISRCLLWTKICILIFILSCTDSSFLLRFLRAKKFSVPITQEGIERYLLLRQAYEFFTNLDMNLPVMNKLLDDG